MRRTVTATAGIAAVFVGLAAHAESARTTTVIELWKKGKPAFGVYAPNENRARSLDPQILRSSNAFIRI
jgi:hypothetical protein